jgi:5-methylcytosine-specific restriction endonuclease McrA
LIAMNDPICPHCDTGAPIHYSGGKSKGRCLACVRSYNKEEIAKKRRDKKLALLAAPDDASGRRVCVKCFRHKLLSEFSPRKNRRCQEKLNKICDTCLTRVYNSDSRRSSGFDEAWWRKKAYTCNTAGRQALAKRRGVKVSKVALKDLDYVCKPQDLLQIFERQRGECYYCTDPLRPEATSVDHATPCDRGGAHHTANFRIACYDCNTLKWTRTEDEFFEFLRAYVLRLQRALAGLPQPKHQ